MKTLTLSVKQRLLLEPLLPQSGRRIEMIVIQSLLREIKMSPGEVVEFELRDGPNGTILGNQKKFIDKEIELSNEQIKILKEIPGKVEDAEQVTIDLLPLLDQIDALSAG
jgi:hypothetical protein